MNEEEILNRLIQKSICINAGGKGCYNPYKNDMDWFSDIDNLVLMYEQLQQENKQLKEKNQKYKELIDKANKFVEENCYEHYDSYNDEQYDVLESKKELLDIIKEVE